MSRKILYLLIFTAVSTLTRDMFSSVFNLYLRQMEFSNRTIGGMTSSLLWGSAIIGLVMSLLADASGRKRVLVISTILFPLCNLALTFLNQPWAMNAVSFLRGGMGILSQTVVFAILVDLTDNKNRVKIFGINMGSMMASGVLGNLLGGYFGEWFGLQVALVCATALFCLSFIPLAKISVIERGISIRTVFDFSMIAPKQKKLLMFYYLSTVAVGFGAGLYINFGNLIYRDLFNLSTSTIGIALSVAQLGTALGNVLSHSFGKRFGPLHFRFWNELLVVPLMIGLILVRQPALFMIIYTTRFILMNSASPIMASIVNSSLPREKISTISGINAFLNNSVRAVAALFFGFIVGANTQGYNLLFSISTSFYALNALFAFLFLRQFRKDAIVLELFRKEKKQ